MGSQFAIVYDILIAVVLVFAIFSGAKRGFVSAVVGIAAVFVGFFCAMTQGDFAGISRILSALNYAYFLGFLSLGVTFVIATGGIDFSIGPVMF